MRHISKHRGRIFYLTSNKKEFKTLKTILKKSINKKNFNNIPKSLQDNSTDRGYDSEDPNNFRDLQLFNT